MNTYCAGEHFDADLALKRWIDAGLPTSGKVDLVSVLSALGSSVQVQSIPASKWPFVTAHAKTPGVPLTSAVTTQRQIHAEVVLSKLGVLPATSYYLSGFFVQPSVLVYGEDTLLFDGHHSLAATVAAGLPVVGWMHHLGGDHISAPRLDRLNG